MGKITLLKSKLHKATVTETQLHYEGSITIGQKLMNEAQILPHEKVQIVNINNGNRFYTYVIEGEEGGKEICLNGAAARKANTGDRVIVLSYIQLEQDIAMNWEPNITVLDEKNNIK